MTRVLQDRDELVNQEFLMSEEGAALSVVLKQRRGVERRSPASLGREMIATHYARPSLQEYEGIVKNR